MSNRFGKRDLDSDAPDKTFELPEDKPRSRVKRFGKSKSPIGVVDNDIDNEPSQEIPIDTRRALAAVIVILWGLCALLAGVCMVAGLGVALIVFGCCVLGLGVVLGIT